MHELSLTASIVDAVTETLVARPELLANGARVKSVRLRVGALAAVVEESLQFCYGVVTEGTPLAGSALVVTTVPVMGHCASCDVDVELPSVQSFLCPQCGAAIRDVRQGRELEIESIEIEDAEEIAQS